MSLEPQPRVVPGGSVLIADSVTDIRPTSRGEVAVTGSHGGETAIRYAIAAGLAGIIVNDAGVGCDEAGIAGLARADEAGLAVAAVSHDSARIGDGEDTFVSGVVSHVNQVAASCGVVGGMPARDAATILVAAGQPSTAPDAASPWPIRASRIVLAPGDPPVIGVDSASAITAGDAGCVVVAGSHGGLVGGAPLRHPVLAAVFNDAGVGKDGAGIARLRGLDELGIPGLTAAHDTARIGDATHAYVYGRISHVNEAARICGATPGQTVRDATAMLARRLCRSDPQARPEGDPQRCHR